jgi:hypothetical protein
MGARGTHVGHCPLSQSSSNSGLTHGGKIEWKQNRRIHIVPKACGFGSPVKKWSFFSPVVASQRLPVHAADGMDRVTSNAVARFLAQVSTMAKWLSGQRMINCSHP